MKKYFSRITAEHWTAKNKLEKAAHEIAWEMDRRLISEDDIPAFKQKFQEKISQLELKFKRCKPLKFSIEKRDYAKGDYWIYCDGVFNMSLFLVKQ